MDGNGGGLGDVSSDAAIVGGRRALSAGGPHTRTVQSSLAVSITTRWLDEPPPPPATPNARADRPRAADGGKMAMALTGAV